MKNNLIRSLPRVTYVWYSNSFRERYVWQCWLPTYVFYMCTK